MLPLNLPSDPSRPATLLCLGAHCDDIEIGCGGTVLSLLEQAPETTVWWIVLSSDERRAEEARRAAACFLEGAGERHVHVKAFRNGYFPFVGDEIKDYVETLKRDVAPDLVLTHYRHDRHQDHRLVSDLTWNTFRDHLILEYEIPKYDGDIGQPNTFVPVTEDQRDAKVHYIMDCFESQRGRQWFTPETLHALMRLRGIECNAPSGYAEAFHARKVTLGMAVRGAERGR
jgi:LmbE family N-acetylglucosaminyl deacetylase